MTIIQQLTNKALGFNKYKVGNRIGWIKSKTDTSEIKRTIKKLPSGTIIKTSTNSENLVIKKRVLTHTGKEIKSYLSNKKQNRMIYISDKNNGDTLYIRTKSMYDFQKGKEIDDIKKSSYQKLFNITEKIKMHLGIIK